MIKFPRPRDGKGVKCPGYARGGRMLKLRFDRYISALSSTLVFIERRGENVRREVTGKWMPPLLFSSRGVACCSWNSPPLPRSEERNRELVSTLPPVIQP